MNKIPCGSPAAVFRIMGLLLLVLSASGCASSPTTTVMVTEKIASPRIVMIQAKRTPWVFEIEQRLRRNGFKIKRMLGQGVTEERVSPTVSKTYREAAARYMVVIEGSMMEQCFGGGYNFNNISVELVDIQENETVRQYTNSGYSEGCPPLSGTIFGEIENTIVNAWE